MKFVGALLVLAGIAGFAWGILHGGMRFSRQDQTTVSDAGQAVTSKVHSLPLAPIAAGVCLLAGVVVLVASRGESHANG